MARKLKGDSDRKFTFLERVGAQLYDVPRLRKQNQLSRATKSPAPTCQFLEPCALSLSLSLSIDLSASL